MCKILIIPHIKAELVDLAWKFAEVVSKPLTKTEQDGFGYMALDSSGNLFGERWVDVKEAFKSKEAITPFEQYIMEIYRGFLSAPDMYNSFGTLNYKEAVSLCLHARTATNSVTIQNTHPFVSGDNALIHNGVVQTHNLKLITSTCDSEGILNKYVEEKVGQNIKNIQELANKLSGYYACAAYTKNEDQWFLDVFKDDRARLDAVFVEELETIVFCTSAEVVYQACKKLKWTISAEFDVKDNFIVRHDPFTGEVVDAYSFTFSKNSFYSKSTPATNVTRLNAIAKTPEELLIEQEELSNYYLQDMTPISDDIPPENYSEDPEVVNANSVKDMIEYNNKYFERMNSKK